MSRASLKANLSRRTNLFARHSVDLDNVIERRRATQPDYNDLEISKKLAKRMLYHRRRAPSAFDAMRQSLRSTVRKSGPESLVTFMSS